MGITRINKQIQQRDDGEESCFVFLVPSSVLEIKVKTGDNTEGIGEAKRRQFLDLEQQSERKGAENNVKEVIEKLRD